MSKDEWFGVMRSFKPEWTPEQLAREWREYRAYRRRYRAYGYAQ